MFTACQGVQGMVTLPICKQYKNIQEFSKIKDEVIKISIILPL